MKDSFKDWLHHLEAVICIPIGWVIYLLLKLLNGWKDKR